MSQSMRKITYYENILEFKENSKEPISLKEINNWHLCRTCLAETREDDVNLKKLSVMDVMQGSFLNIMEMLIKTTNLEISLKDKLPLKVCKECFNKITTLYYFAIQVRKADKVLKRLANKITFSNIPLEETKTEFKNITQENVKLNDKVLGENTNEEENELCKSEELDTFKANDIPDDNMIIEVEELFDIHGDFENLDEFVNATTEHKNQMIKNDLNDDITNEAAEDNEYSLYGEQDMSQLETEYLADSDTDVELRSEIESILEQELMDSPELSEIDKEEIPVLDTEIKNKLNTVRTIKRNNNVQEVTSTTGFKHRQPRVKSPLLDDFTCALCQEPFERQNDLMKHVRELHPNSKAFKCRICNNFFSHIQSLSRHMNTHKESLVKNECDFCTKTFIRLDDLKRHLRTHTGERPYACALCDKSYQQIAELKEHQKKHFGNSIYTCNDCDQTYSSRAGLFIHRRKVHKSDVDNKDDPYVCSLCGECFESKVDLKNHEKKHLATQVFQCVECDEIFQYRKTFNLHRRKCNTQKTLKKSGRRFKKIKLDDQIPVDESEENEVTFV